MEVLCRKCKAVRIDTVPQYYKESGKYVVRRFSCHGGGKLHTCNHDPTDERPSFDGHQAVRLLRQGRESELKS